jgi:protein-L-isoaspartate(D-aspartate) O-methyltransferase
MYSTPIAGGPLAFIRHGGASRPIEMTYSEAAINEARNAMVDDLVRRRIIRTPAVERAFRRVRRHAFLTPPYGVATDSLAEEFVETDDPCAVYADATVALKPEKNIHCLSPGVLAREIEALGVAEGMRILHVETGGGYYTAVLGEIVGERGSVVGINYEEDIAEMAAAFLAKAGYTNVNILSGDGAAGVPEAGPFDRILVSAGASDIAPAWIEQLYDDGRLVLPLCHLGPLGPRISGGVILAVEKATDGLTGNISSVAVFVPLQGLMAPTTGESVSLAEGLHRWFALEDFYRTELPIRILMKSDAGHPPDPTGVPWFMETRNAAMWVEPN